MAQLPARPQTLNVIMTRNHLGHILLTRVVVFCPPIYPLPLCAQLHPNSTTSVEAIDGGRIGRANYGKVEIAAIQALRLVDCNFQPCVNVYKMWTGSRHFPLRGIY